MEAAHHPLKGYDAGEQAPADIPSTAGEPTIATPASGVLGEVTQAEVGNGPAQHQPEGARAAAAAAVDAAPEQGKQAQAGSALLSTSSATTATGPGLHVTTVGHARVFDLRDMERTPLDEAALAEGQRATDPAAILDGASFAASRHRLV